MFYPQQQDMDILFQKNKQIYIKLYLLNKNMQTVDYLQGELTAGNITIDATSDIRTVASFTFYVKNKTNADQYSDIWMDKFVDLRIGFYYNRTREILWYPLGLFIFNENGFTYNATERSVSCSCVDIMGYLTGLRAGMLRGLKTVIPYGSVVTDVVRDTIVQLGFMNNYLIEPNSSPDYLTVPYDIELETGATVYDILRKIADLYPATEFWFDTDGTFRWGYTPTGTADTALFDDTVFGGLIISESLTKTFSNVKNCIEVWGKDDISARLVLVDSMPAEPNPDYSYKVNPDSPFTVDKLGEIWDVKSGGDYAVIYSEQLAADRCSYELFLSTSAQDTISLNMMLIPFLGVNQKISYRTKVNRQTDESEYMTKRISFDITSATMQVDAVRFTPLYSWL